VFPEALFEAFEHGLSELLQDPFQGLQNVRGDSMKRILKCNDKILNKQEPFFTTSLALSTCMPSNKVSFIINRYKFS
jgi:hypothetical protein